MPDTCELHPPPTTMSSAAVQPVHPNCAAAKGTVHHELKPHRLTEGMDSKGLRHSDGGILLLQLKGLSRC
jgi:hypothetical protein